MKNISIYSKASALLIAVLLLASQTMWAGSVTTPANLPAYYSGIDGKSSTTLWSAVHTVAKTGYSTSISYNNVWTVYATTDAYKSGNTTKIYDMYGGCDFTYSSDQCGSYSNECDCYNREHSIPKSWFGGSESANTPGSDVFHLVPTDGKINNTRSNYAFGEVQTAKTTHNTNGMVNKLGTAKSITIENTMMGASATKSCSSSPVFEPDDVYKGDFARGYFGTLLKWAGDYSAFTTGDGASMFSGTYTEAGHWGLTEYGIALLLKWHRQDPVSQKEIDRNNGIQQTQGNRNPFIDYPILAEYIWGKYAGQTFSLDNAVGSFDTSNFTPGVSDGDKSSTSPTIVVSTTSITMDPTANGGTTAQTFTVTGANLTGAISIAKSGSSYITVSPTSITSNYNSANTITVTYHPTATGNHSATLTISSTGATSKTVTVSGTCTTVYNVTWMADGSPYHSNTASSGSKPTMPSNDPDDCSADRVFMGWTDDDSYSGDGSDLFTDSEGAPSITTNKTFYAVYADKTTSGGGSSTVASVTFNTAGSDGSTDISSNISSIVSSASGISSYSGTKVYAGTSGAKLGSGSATGSITLTLSSTASVTQVTITGAKYGSDTGKLTVTAGSTEIDSKDPGSGVTYTAGSAVETNKITIATTSKRAYVTSITVTAGGGSTTYDNYSVECDASTPKVTVTFYPNGGTGNSYTQQVSQSTSTALTANTFTREGYTFAGWATSANGNVIYADGANINTNSDIGLYAKWTALPTYTVTFMNNGAEHATRSGWAGQTMTAVANPTTCDGYTFEGWSTSQYATNNTSAPSLSTPTTIPAANTTYYAVYSKTESGGGDPVATDNYKKITSTSELTDGKYLIVANNSGAYNAMSTTWKDTYYLAGTDITPTNDIITTTTANIIWQITVSNSQASIYNATSHYLYIKSSTSGNKTYYNIILGDNTTDNKFTYSVSNGAWTLTSVTYTDRQLEYYTSQTRWAYYTSQDAPIYLYKQQYDTGSTTYHTTAPNCCQATLTVVSPDDTMGTVGIE